MPIIINDFDIKVEPEAPPPSRGADAEAAPPQSKPAQLRPEDIRLVICVNRERLERVRAD